jgi:hypothetical protein
MKFNLSSFSFETKNPNDVLGEIKVSAFYEDNIVQNTVRFFKETNARYIQQPMISSSRNFASFKKIYSATCWSDIEQWYCHISAPYFVLNEENHNLVFGFCHSFDRDTKIFNKAFLHSFIISDSGVLRDPHFESLIKQEEYYFSEDLKNESHPILSYEEWVKNETKWNLTESMLKYLYGNYTRDLVWRNKVIEERKQKGPRATIEDTSFYFGTVIPPFILEVLFKSNPKYPESMENLWGYLKNKIFIDEEKTSWFIDVVKNDGSGFSL